MTENPNFIKAKWLQGRMTNWNYEGTDYEKFSYLFFAGFYAFYYVVETTRQNITSSSNHIEKLG